MRLRGLPGLGHQQGKGGPSLAIQHVTEEKHFIWRRGIRTPDTLAGATLQPGNIVGISVHTGNARRGYEVGRMARERGAWVVYGGIHATLYSEEAFERG